METDSLTILTWRGELVGDVLVNLFPSVAIKEFGLNDVWVSDLSSQVRVYPQSSRSLSGRYLASSYNQIQDGRQTVDTID